MDTDIYLKERVRLLSRLAEIARQKQITHDVIAERIGLKRPSVTRMLSGKFPPTLDNFLMLLDAIETNFEELQ